MHSITEVRLHLRLMEDKAEALELQPIIEPAVAAAADYLSAPIP